MTDVALRFGARDDGLTAQFRRVNASLDQFERRAQQVASRVDNLGKVIVGAFAVERFAAFFNATTANAEAIDNLATRTGLSLQAIQRLQLTSEQTGLSVDAAAAAINRMQRALVDSEDGTGRQAAAFARLNLNIAEIRNLAPEQQFETVARALANVGDKAQQVAIGSDLLGRSFAEQLPVILQAADGFEAAAEGLERIGGPLADDTIQKLDSVGDSVGLTGAALRNLGSELLSFVSPAIEGLANSLTNVISTIRILGGGGGEVEQLQRKLEILREARDSIPVFFNFGYVDRGGVVLGKAELDSAIADIGRRLEDLRNPLTGAGVVDLSFGDFGVNAPRIGGIPTGAGGPRQPTPSERRQQAQQESQVAIDAQLAQFELEEVINQEHLDELLRQTSEYGAQRVQIETDFQRLIAQSREQFGIQEINWEVIKSQSIAEIAGGLFSSLASQNQKFAKAQQAIALAQAIWYTASGVANALRSVPFPANIAAAAKVAAVGAIQIAKIKATRFDGGGAAASGGAAISASGDAGGSSPALNDTSQATAKQTATQVYIQGVVTQQVVDQLLDGLRDSFDRDVVVIRGGTAQAREFASGTV